MTDDFTMKLEGREPPEERDEQAICIDTINGPMFLAGVGWGIESDIEAGLGIEEIGPVQNYPDDSVGIWIWSGKPTWRSGITYEGIDEGAEPEYPEGKWRRPTDEELKMIAVGDYTFLGEPWIPKARREAREKA